MGQVLERKTLFMQAKCPKGSLAEHSIHGMCEVLASEGFYRQIEVILATEPTYVSRIVKVNVKDLRVVDPAKDMGL